VGPTQRRRRLSRRGEPAGAAGPPRAQSAGGQLGHGEAGPRRGEKKRGGGGGRLGRIGQLGRAREGGGCARGWAALVGPPRPAGLKGEGGEKERFFPF
jgi:hypothetical protein